MRYEEGHEPFNRRRDRLIAFMVARGSSCPLPVHHIALLAPHGGEIEMQVDMMGEYMMVSRHDLWVFGRRPSE